MFGQIYFNDDLFQMLTLGLNHFSLFVNQIIYTRPANSKGVFTKLSTFLCSVARAWAMQWCTVRGHWMAPQSRHSKLYNLTPEADGHRCTPLHNLDATHDWKLRLGI